MFCRSLLTAITLVALHTSSAAAAAAAGPSGCVSFDIHWNLLAFGFNGKDYNAGTQDAWSSSSGRKTVPSRLVASRVLTFQSICRIVDGHYY
jgi:hypothetical protein